MQQLTGPDKQELKNNKAIAAGFTKHLAVRHLLKQELEKLFAIPAQHSATVDKVLYDLVPLMDKKDEFLAYLNQFHVDAALPEAREVCGLFFNEQGIIKIWQEHANIFATVSPLFQLNNAKQHVFRGQINALVGLMQQTEHTIPYLQQAHKYIGAAMRTEGQTSQRYQSFAKDLCISLINIAANKIIQFCPDCSTVYASVEQNALQELIMQRIAKAMQLTDASIISNFMRTELPLLRQAKQYLDANHVGAASTLLFTAEHYKELKNAAQAAGASAIVVASYALLKEVKKKKKVDNKKDFKNGAPSEDPKDPKERKIHNNKEITNQQDKADAERLGFVLDKDPPFKTQGRLAFRKKNRWISADRDGHKGGRWKMFDRKGDRKGTFDKDLNLIAV